MITEFLHIGHECLLYVRAMHQTLIKTNQVHRCVLQMLLMLRDTLRKNFQNTSKIVGVWLCHIEGWFQDYTWSNLHVHGEHQSQKKGDSSLYIQSDMSSDGDFYMSQLAHACVSRQCTSSQIEAVQSLCQVHCHPDCLEC